MFILEGNLLKLTGLVAPSHRGHGIRVFFCLFGGFSHTSIDRTTNLARQLVRTLFGLLLLLLFFFGCLGVFVLVLFVLLRKFLYRPVMNVIEQRQKQIDDAIADAEGKKNDAQAVLAQAQDKLQNVDTEAAQRREAYEKQAEKEKEQLLQDAQRQADAIVAEGKAAAEAEHARRLRDANAETSALARDMCEKLLARNLTQQDDARLLDDLLQKAGDSNGK